LLLGKLSDIAAEYEAYDARDAMLRRGAVEKRHRSPADDVARKEAYWQEHPPLAPVEMTQRIKQKDELMNFFDRMLESITKIKDAT